MKPNTPHLPRIRIVAIDLDDTLLQEDLTISAVNRDALLRAEAAGITVLLASGRVPEAMQRYAEELGMDTREGYMISGNGTLLIRSDTHEELVRHTLPIKQAVQAFRELDAQGFALSAYHRGAIYASRDNRWVSEDSRLSGFPKHIINDFEPFIRRIGPLKLLILADPDQVNTLLPDLRSRYGHIFNIITSKPFFLELLPKDADKGTALQHLAEHLNIPPEQVMAIGDSHNDLGMIRYAGFGTAVGNALPEIKKAARIVLNRRHGEGAVAEAIDTWVLQSVPV